MILPHLGKLCTAQDLTPTTQDSENVIQISAIDWSAYTDLWLIIDTETIATGDGSDVFDFSLVVSQESTLDTNLEVAALRITGIADTRLATAGNRIFEVNIGQSIKYLNNDTYDYIGLILGVTAGATLSVNATFSTGKPLSIPHAQTVVSNVGVPDLAS